MKTLKLHQITTLALAFLFGATALAAPTSGPYVTDPQNEYVHDATSEAINTVNMVLCIVNGMNINDSGMLNVGPYVALIDMNKCNSKGGAGSSSSGSSGAAAAVNYMTAIVDATRANDTSPMIAKVWMSMTEEGRSQDIYVKLTATTPPSATLPYGVFRLDFLGKDENGIAQMNGYIDSSTGSLQYYETGTNSSNVSLNMAASTTNAGNGIMTLGVSSWNPTALTYNFNYNANNFRRSDGTNDQCFDRLKANAKRSVWRYGTYKNSDGTRVDQANPSFSITGTDANGSYYGYAGYWGIGFQGLDLNALPDGLVSGLEVRDQRPNNTTTYSLSKVKGKLTKWAKVDTTLSALNGIPFTFYGNLSGKTNNTTIDSNGWGNWQMVWNGSSFAVIGTQTCGSSGCSLTALSAAVNTDAFNAMPISGWSDSFGGNLNIPSTGLPHANGDTISYFTQSTVIPGSLSAPANLECLSNCPDFDSVLAANNYVAGGAAVVPFNTATATQWNWGATKISYTFTAGGLQNGGSAMTINNAAFFAPGSNYQYGVSSGRLFDPSAVAADKITVCGVGGAGNMCEPSAPAVYYTWSTSTDQWNQTMWLTNGATTVTFDPPQNIQYTVPADADPNWAGKNIQLQFNGFGNLGGIPGHCVSPVNNAEVPCSQNTRYVPAFSIPNGATMTLNGTQLIVKALDAEVRLNDLGTVGVDAAADTACGAMSLTTSLTPPSGGTHDPSLSTDAYYIGVKPTVTTAPKVIDGVVQY